MPISSMQSQVRAASSPPPRRPPRGFAFSADSPTATGLVSTSEALATRSRRSTRAKYRLRDPTLAPEEVLFSRRGGPQRYMENGFYFAHEALPDGGRDVLPDSDLLKAVHAYASRFYERLGQRHDTGSRNDCFVGARHVDEQSMDETALLAFGILLEEAGREVLGRRGDLVFTEGLSDEPARPDDRNETEGDAGEASRASPDGRRDSRAEMRFGTGIRPRDGS